MSSNTFLKSTAGGGGSNSANPTTSSNNNLGSESPTATRVSIPNYSAVASPTSRGNFSRYSEATTTTGTSHGGGRRTATGRSSHASSQQHANLYGDEPLLSSPTTTRPGHTRFRIVGGGGGGGAGRRNTNANPNGNGGDYFDQHFGSPNGRPAADDDGAGSSYSLDTGDGNHHSNNANTTARRLAADAMGNRASSAGGFAGSSGAVFSGNSNSNGMNNNNLSAAHASINNNDGSAGDQQQSAARFYDENGDLVESSADTSSRYSFINQQNTQQYGFNSGNNNNTTNNDSNKNTNVMASHQSDLIASSRRFFMEQQQREEAAGHRSPATTAVSGGGINWEETDDDDEEEDEDEEEDDDDFGDETFKLVADDINVNVGALLSKLRETDALDRRETMLKKGNVKNANILQVEMYDDEETDDETNSSAASSSETESADGGDNDNNNNRIIGDSPAMGGANSGMLRRGGGGTTSYTRLSNAPQQQAPHQSRSQYALTPANLQQHENSSAALVADGGKIVEIPAMPYREGEDDDDDDDDDAAGAAAGGAFAAKLRDVDKERMATQKANRSAAATASGEGDGIAPAAAHDGAAPFQAKRRLTADKHSVQRGAGGGRKSSNRFDGRESEEMSASTFREDASRPSFYEDGTLKPRSALKSKKRSRAKSEKSAASKAKRAGFGAGGGKDGGRVGVSFSQNEVSEVCIFEVGDELYVGVQFKRSWVGWVAAFLAIIFETVFDVHVVYLYLTTPYPIGAVQAWVGTNRFAISAILFLVAYFAGIGVQPLKHVLTGYGILILSIMALCLGIAVSLEAVVVEVTDATHFFVASVLYCLWIVLYRLFIKEAVFLLEVIAILVSVSGFIVSNMTYETNMTVKAAITGNVVIFIASVLYAAYFFLLSRVRKWAPIVPMATFQGIFAVLIALPLAAILKTSAQDMFAFATNGTYFGHAIIIAIEGVISNILLILTIDYLDVLSVASIFILKSAAMPIFTKLITLDNFDLDPTKKEQVPPIEMTWYLFLGYALAIVGCITTVVFASLRRSFVMRRIASSKRKKAPNPYTKKRRKLEKEAAARGITVEELQAQQSQAQARQLEQYQQFLAQQQHYQQGQHQQNQPYYAAEQGGQIPMDLQQQHQQYYQYFQQQQQQMYQQQQQHHGGGGQQQPVRRHASQRSDASRRRPSPALRK